ncbi:hypothetical protein [Dongia sp.]|uniref:hypothetical protein n=1 Tax=Dongia sp. TaxID=1977262 RepID=UPI0035B48882
MRAEILYGFVLLSAIAHPVWNAMVKASSDRLLSMAAIPTVGAILGIAALPFVDWPSIESIKWLVLTSIAHYGYYALVVRSYAVGDLGVVYPLARGAVPVITTAVAFVAIGETLTVGTLIAVGLISLGILALTFGMGAKPSAVGLALATSVTIASYSFLGGVGVRVSGSVLGFLAVAQIINAGGIFGYVLLFRRRGISAFLYRHGATSIMAGIISTLGFLVYLLAVNQLPIGPITALRETSVVFGTLIGTFILKEGFGFRRIAASLFVASGVVILGTMH